MRQSTVIFGTLLAAFVIYITIRGQLPSYLSLFTGGTTGPVAPKNSTTNDSKGSSGNSGSVVDTVVSTANKFLHYAGKVI